MASLRKHPKSRYWIGCFTDNTGTQRQRSTKTTDRVAALRIATSWEDAYRRQLTEVQLRDAYGQISEEINGRRLNFETAEAFFNRWLSDKKIERKEASVEKYAGVIRRFLQFIGPKAKRDLMVVAADDITGYRNSLPLKPGTVNSHLKVLRVALEDAVRAGAILQNPAKQVRTIKKGSVSARRPFTPEEINKLVAAAQPEWRGLILAGVCTGQRLGDLARLRWSNVDTEKRMVSLKSRKTGQPVSIWILDPLWDHLTSSPATDDPNAPLFPKAFAAAETSGSVQPLSKEFHALLVSVDLAQSWSGKRTGTGRSVPRDNTGLSFHALRHTAVTMLKKAGVPETVVMAIVGHSSRAISDLYTHMDDATIADWMQKASKSYVALTG